MVSLPQQAENHGPSHVPYELYAGERDRRIKAEQLHTQEHESHLKTQHAFQNASHALRHANQKIHQLENRVTELETERKHQRALWRSSFKPEEKFVITELQRQIDPPVVQDAEGFSRFCYETAAINIGMSSSTPKRKIEAILDQCPNFPIELKEVEERDDEGPTIPRLYVKAKDSLHQAAATISIEQPRKQGGNQYLCQRCGSADVKILRRLHCNCCGHETDLEPSFPNGKLKNNTSTTGRSNSLWGNTTVDSHPSEGNTGETGRTNLLLGNTKAITENITASVQLDDVLKTVSPPLCETTSDCEDVSDQNDLLVAAELLMAIAGQADDHIEMSRRGAKKYYTVDRPLFVNDLLDHLRGGRARGAGCSRPDGQTRVLGWDADDSERWEQFQRAARHIAEAGYLPILEESPAGRGGHLWIIFSDLVSASAARAHVHALVPGLADVVEYWPSPVAASRWNRVRLPGGRYVRPGVDAWCRLISVADGEMSQDGQSAAKLLLSHQTPASIVPLNEVTQPEPEEPLAPQTAETGVSTKSSDQVGETPRDEEPGQVSMLQDASQPEGGRLWFRWTPAELVAWYNERTSLNELLPDERNGYGLASWRGERTASVAKRGDRWTDFGAGARRADGTQDSGDAFELRVRLSGKPKGHVMSETGRELAEVARVALESAARSDQPLPVWLEEITTDAGWQRYWRVGGEGGR